MTQPLARPLDRAEAFFWFLDRCSSMNFAVVAEGRGRLEPQAVEAALARAQGVHPALAVAIEAGVEGGLAFVPRPGTRARFTREAVAGDWRAGLAARLAAPFALGEAPLFRAHWFDRGADAWAFAVVFHHSIGDGRSGFRLVASVVDDARGVRVLAGTREPEPPLTSLFPAALRGEAGHARAQAWKETLRREPLRPATLPGFAREAGDACPGIIGLRFEAPVVQGLARAARASGASVHGLIGAAELLAARELFAAGEPPALMLTSPVDLRGQLVAPVGNATPGFHVTLLSSIATVDGHASLPALAKFLTDDLRRQVAEGCGHLFYQLVPAVESLPPAPEAIAGFAAYMRRMPTALVLSNVGRVEAMPEALGVRVDAISFALCPMAHQPLFVAASTWGGELTLNVVHDAARLAPGTALSLAGAMERILRRAAG